MLEFLRSRSPVFWGSAVILITGVSLVALAMATMLTLRETITLPHGEEISFANPKGYVRIGDLDLYTSDIDYLRKEYFGDEELVSFYIHGKILGVKGKASFHKLIEQGAICITLQKNMARKISQDEFLKHAKDFRKHFYENEYESKVQCTKNDIPKPKECSQFEISKVSDFYILKDTENIFSAGYAVYGNFGAETGKDVFLRVDSVVFQNGTLFFMHHFKFLSPKDDLAAAIEQCTVILDSMELEP